ncbi:hypothetical protein MKX03_017077 [Papaver bracteatum]|nr:hypothetical protein MKX03_017077 [Papaver bracteatum]
MATSILLRSARSALRSTDLASGCLPVTGATARMAKPFSQRSGSVARLFSSKPLGDDLIVSDLGTSNSCEAATEGKGSLHRFQAQKYEGARIIPSLMGGVHTNPTNIIMGKRHMFGRRDGDSDSQTRREVKCVPYKIIKTPNGDEWVEANEPTCSPSQIGAPILY